MAGSKESEGKVSLALVPPSSIRGLARVFEYGAKKYGVSNWRQGIPVTRLYEASLRHLLNWMDGQDLDLESGLPHLDHVMCNVVMMRELLNSDEGWDDRTYIAQGLKTDA